jgi:hypothetical protein
MAVASDERIAQILELQEELHNSHLPSSNASPAMAELLISLYEQERMYGPIAEAYVLAAYEYNGIGDAWTAQKYARLAVELGLLYSGPHDEHVHAMELLLKDQKSHWSWKMRTKKKEKDNA